MDEDDTIHFPTEFTDLPASPAEMDGALQCDDKFVDFDYVCEEVSDCLNSESESTDNSNKMEMD